MRRGLSIKRKYSIPVAIPRNREIVKKAFLPDETLQSIADAYGITRERVRQIVNGVLGFDYGKAKGRLRKISPYLKCKWCGGQLGQGRIKTKFCSVRCRENFQKYDWKNLKKCEQCGDKFYPPRNWESMREGLRRFCSMKCYMESETFKEKIAGRVLSKEFIKKLRKEFERR